MNKYNIKLTKQRKDILSKLESYDYISIKDLEDLLPDVNKSTIYRNVHFLEESNIISPILLDDNIVYSLKSSHKHYISCAKCKKNIELDKCPIDEKIIDEYKIFEHNISIKGICPKCQKKLTK